jgi:imidazole glycerol-phosphate synthase subunit HisH
MMQKVVIVDVGSGNLFSVKNAIRTASPDVEVVVSRSIDVIQNADKLVLPGQGAMGSWLSGMNENGLMQPLLAATQHIPTLGICLGMQVMMDFSEEDGGIKGLGFFPGSVTRFHLSEPLGIHSMKIPHMGWNRVAQRVDHPLWFKIDDGKRFYFVHSYYVKADLSHQSVGETNYIEKFCSAIARDNLFAVQFHPEKSQQQGLQLLRNFVNWDGTP